MSSPSARRGRLSQPASPGSQRFPKSRRLRKRSEFQRVYREGIRWTSAYFSAFCRATGEAGPGRTGLAVGRGIGGAVVRNRVKRRLREAIRRNMAELPDGREIVFQARQQIVGVEWPMLVSEVRRVFQQAANPRFMRRKRRPRRA